MLKSFFLTGNGRTRCVITKSSISENSADIYGGGVFFDHEGWTLSLSARLSRCTLARNTAGGRGGGIYWENPGQENGFISVSLCTISENEADLGGGVFTDNGGSANLLLTNSIVAGNTAGSGVDIYEYWSSGVNVSGNNLFSDVLGMRIPLPNPAVTLVAAPLLAPLGDYGGPTLTMPPLPGSPSIDAAPGSIFNRDQRSLPVVGTPDIGAAEFQGESDIILFWQVDPDGDGNPFGVEEALGTDQHIPDVENPRNLDMQTDPNGHPRLTFGRNAGAIGGTQWILARSPNLDPENFVEIFRFDGTSTIPESPNPDLDFTLGIDFITITDLAPPAERAYYRFEALKPSGP